MKVLQTGKKHLLKNDFDRLVILYRLDDQGCPSLLSGIAVMNENETLPDVYSKLEDKCLYPFVDEIPHTTITLYNANVYDYLEEDDVVIECNGYFLYNVLLSVNGKHVVQKATAKLRNKVDRLSICDLYSPTTDIVGIKGCTYIDHEYMYLKVFAKDNDEAMNKALSIIHGSMLYKLGQCNA